MGLCSCASKPWVKHPMPRHPDHYCQTGPSEAGVNYYVWECVNNERVVIRNWNTGLFSLPSIKETAACGGTTKFEDSLKENENARCDKKPSQWIISE